MKLQWESNANKNLMNYEQATEYAKSLGEGWRLPTKEELKEAYHDKAEGFEPDYYWSSSTYDQNTNDAWYIDFSKGYMFTVHKTDINYVRCVRDF